MGFVTAFSGRLLAWVVAAVVAGTPPQAPAARPSSETLPASTLPIVLAGVMLDPQAPSRSACLLRCAFPPEKQGKFLVGQTACELAEIAEIRQDRVVFRNLLTNRRELLVFSRPEASTGAPSPPPAPVVTVTKEAVAVDLAKGAVDHYLDNLPQLLDAALAAPRYRDTGGGQRAIEGFEIGKIKEASVVEQLGLKNGDVLLEVNGQSLDGLPTIIKLLGQIQNMSQVKVTVLRNGQKVSFVFNRK